jgi:uncharacterized protein (TIRG00374 family)
VSEQYAECGLWIDRFTSIRVWREGEETAILVSGQSVQHNTLELPLHGILPECPADRRGLTQRNDVIAGEFDVAVAGPAVANGFEVLVVESEAFQIVDHRRVGEAPNHQHVGALLQLRDGIRPRSKRFAVGVQSGHREHTYFSVDAGQCPHEDFASIETVPSIGINRHRRLQPRKRIRLDTGTRSGKERGDRSQTQKCTHWNIWIRNGRAVASARIGQLTDASRAPLQNGAGKFLGGTRIIHKGIVSFRASWLLHVGNTADLAASKRTFRLAWLLGAALLALVVGGALHVSDSREFVLLAERAGPWWMAAAVFLQAGTYVAQGDIWRRVARAAGAPLRRTDAFSLSLAKLFADQALPSAGISGSLVVARALRERKMRDEAVNAAVLINVASYHIAYVTALGVALGILIARHRANALIVIASILFVAFAVVVTAAVTLLSGRPDSRFSRVLRTIKPLRGLLEFMGRADPALARDLSLLRAATLQQIAIVACDAATMWVLLRSIGVAAQVEAVFASFMVSSLVRTLGVVPGGLGTFEATSVVTLTLTGATVAQALSATLLFRGLSFWIPMAPGLWFSRRITVPLTGASDPRWTQ